MSEAGSPWASEPPSVPRLRTCGSAIVAATVDGEAQVAASPTSACGRHARRSGTLPFSR